MFVKPAVNRARFSENLAHGMAARGYDYSHLAMAAKVPAEIIRSAMHGGAVTDDDMAALCTALHMERDDLAPIIDMRDPDRGDRLPVSGRDVPNTLFWRRAVAQGDVMVVPDHVMAAESMQSAAPLEAASEEPASTRSRSRSYAHRNEAVDHSQE